MLATSESRQPQRHDADSLRLLIESTTDYAIFVLDPNGIVTSWNTGAERMKGYSRSDVIGKHFSIFYPHEARATGWPEKELEYALRDGRFEDEGWRVRKDGTTFWANVVITALRTSDGTLVGYGKVSRDLTERRKAEQTLKDSEERFRLIVESTMDYAIFMLDPNGIVASWNAGAERIKQYTADEVIGKHFSIFYPDEANERGWPAEELRRAESSGRVEDEGWRVRKDGTQFWANVVITALRGTDGSLRGYAKVTRDISERKVNEERIQDLAQQLERRVVELAATNSELSQQSSENQSFVYSVSHDLRAPLVNLQGFSHELLLTSGELANVLSNERVPKDIQTKANQLLQRDLAESVGFVRHAVRQLSNIIDGLLRLSRAGRIEYQIDDVDMNRLAAEIVAANHATIVASGAKVAVKPLPPVRGDRISIGQVLANLIGNSLKSFDAKRPGEIVISANDAVPPIFTVEDNGIGIPIEYQSKLFQVFQHVHDSRRRGEGMGLAIVRRIVERHGGRIWFESAPNQGTKFHFVIGQYDPSGKRTE